MSDPKGNLLGTSKNSQHIVMNISNRKVERPLANPTS